MRRSSFILRSAAMALGAATAAFVSAAAAAPLYRVTLIPLVPGQVLKEGSQAMHINDHGAVGGVLAIPAADGSGPVYPRFRWSAQTGIELMPRPGRSGVSIASVGIDDRDRIHATVWKTYDNVQVGVWGAGPHLRWTVPPDRDFHRWVMGVNGRGDVAGTNYDLRTAQRRAMLWTDDGQAIDLGIDATPAAVTNRRMVVGHSYASRPTQGFFWTPDRGVTLMGPFPGDEGDGDTQLYDANEDGVIVGVGMKRVFYKSYPFRWTERGGFEVLDAPGCTASSAIGIDAGGTIIGDCLTRNNDEGEGVVWFGGPGMHRMIDLLDPADPLSLGVQSVILSDINASGVVVGSAIIDGLRFAAVFTPIE